MSTPLPPEREDGQVAMPPAWLRMAGGHSNLPMTRRGRAGEGESSGRGPTDKAYDTLPTERSRELRNNATPAERKLWSVLSNRQLGGVRFNRQVVIRPFICDLVARSAKLVIEIDGGQHGESVGYDVARTAFLEAKGYRVLRFWKNDVLENIEGVVRSIESILNDRPSPSRLRRSSPPAPTGGE